MKFSQYLIRKRIRKLESARIDKELKEIRRYLEERAPFAKKWRTSD